MSVPKVCGIETEYGVSRRGGGDDNPVVASSLLINAYVDDKRVGWDFEDETPARDARGFTRDASNPPDVETHLVNTVLTNGARYYVDHAHPEYSTPECTDALSLLLADKAGERIIAKSMELARLAQGSVGEIVTYKNNSDGKGNSYGCHENYLMDRNCAFGEIVKNLLPWFVTRQIFTGAGKVGSEHDREGIDFQISARSDFFEEEVGLETTIRRPIVNTRDEPHAMSSQYRRLHVIVGDANLCELSTFLKVGTTAIVLAMIEDNAIENDLSIYEPVRALREVSRDLTCSSLLELRSGRSASPLDLQWEFFNSAQRYAERTGLEHCGGEIVGAEVLRRWEEVLSALEVDPLGLDGRLDWVTKYCLLERFRERDGLKWDDPKLALIDLQYHDVRPERSLYERLVQAGTIERLLTEEEIEQAVSQPPHDTRAYFRGECLRRWPKSIVAANWDSIVFDVGSGSLQRVPMMDPLKGTRSLVEALLNTCETPLQLIEKLGTPH
ncbi:MAG: depupylase/deamidase Dop [Actinomycetes bacterium]